MMDWIKVKSRELTPEELEFYPDVAFIWDMKNPDLDETVLLTDGKTVWSEVWYDYGDYEGFEYTDPDDYENLWWMSYPEPPMMEVEQ